MKRLLITKDVTYASKIGGGTIAGERELTSLVDGALAIFNDKGELLDMTDLSTIPAAIATSKFFKFAVGRGTLNTTNGVDTSNPVVIKNFRYESAATSAAAGQRSFVGSNGSSGALNLPTAAAGNIITLKIVDKSTRFLYPADTKSYEYVYTAADTNNTAITNLIAKINADKDRVVDALVVGSQAGIRLDSRVTGDPFQILLTDSLANATITYAPGTNAIAPTKGVGTATLIAALEQYLEAELGRTNQVYNADLYWTKPRVAANTTYNQVNVWWAPIREIDLDIKFGANESLILAIPSSGANLDYADVVALLEVIQSGNYVEPGS